MYHFIYVNFKNRLKKSRELELFGGSGREKAREGSLATAVFLISWSGW